MAGRAASSGLRLVAPGCCRRTPGCGGSGALTDREGGRQSQPEFFAEVDDGPVTLTFHFCSGTQITSRLAKAGSAVTGSPVRRTAGRRG
ncbi:hypothetical protein AB0B71_16105 [Micromonospora echinofusca]|uniref:hypothetical protein n=1 Tax=Micromonospora echinofusca TaxID=47858 RepID=UPI00340EA91A